MATSGFERNQVLWYEENHALDPWFDRAYGVE